MEHSKKILLSTEHLSVGYRDGDKANILFEDLNLSLQAGELVCFMGPNGVGKSTLIRTLAGLQPSINSAGDKATIRKEGVPTKISIVLTDRITAVNMTVRELVTYGRYPYLDWNIKLTKEDKEIIEQSIGQTHVEYLIDRKLYELSDGQLQMAMIARALAQDTPIILLDEPTAHLDLNNRVEIMNLLRDTARTKDKAILVATHELDLALQTADLIWLAGSDNKILTGIPEDMVLNGLFDEVFKFKGFDLKTGKVFHNPHRNTGVCLIGEGHAYLWTKSALERCGFLVIEKGDHTVTIVANENKNRWDFQGETFYSLKELIHHLSKSINPSFP